MKFYEISVDTEFTIANDENIYKKVKEQRVSCCKVKVNAINVKSTEDMVFKPMQEVSPTNVE